jgi:hypothetical protein
MRREAENRDNTHENVYLSADMQKAMLFPIIKVKNNYFNEKLTLYNQTFSELGQKSHAFCYLSFDGEVGKSANEFVNYYLKVLTNKKYENAKNMFIWVDNSSSQNKNWILISNLLLFINDISIKVENLFINYLEVGHTFMSADSVHGCIGKYIKNCDNIYTFDQFVDEIKKSRKNMTIETLTHENIRSFDKISKKNVSKELKISKVKKFHLKKGSLEVFVKFSHEESEEFIPKYILDADYKTLILENNKNKTSLIDKFDFKSNPNGITKQKLESIKKYYNCIPIDYISFFEDLSLKDSVDSPKPKKTKK